MLNDFKPVYKIIILIMIAFLIPALTGCSYRPNFSYDTIRSDISITDMRDTIEITPAVDTGLTTALLFYPGGLVDSHVYDELLADFSAESGIMSVVVKMPANLAVFSINSGIDVIEEYSNIDTWIIAGHSLGGSMAAASVNDNRDTYKGLIFMDSYPADSDNLSNWNGAVLSLFSSIEKISDAERMAKTLALIPPATWLTDTDRNYPAEKTNYSVLHQIDGGSHSYFGTYGPQDGDYTPTIERDDFHAEVVDYMVEFFIQNGWI